MGLLFVVLLLIFGGGAASLALHRNPLASKVAAVGVGGGCLLGLGFALMVLSQGVTLAASLPVPLPIGQCLFVVDPVTAVFLLPAFLICALASALLPARLAAQEGNTEYGRHGFFFALLVGGMVLVFTAADGVFFLLSWEVMSLAPFFLLSPKDRNSRERYSGWIYLVAAHLGALPLLLLFALMSVEAGGTAFAQFAAFSGWGGTGLLFLLALVGFGVKFAMVPLHVWIPEAYPAAPGHVAAVLAGAMVNAGVYGLVRILLLVGPPDVWWAYALMGVGGVSGLLGVLFALAQPDMKRTLAYSSVENMGIICLALGAGILASLSGKGAVALCFLAGGLLHMWNHSLFKALYFLGASAVQQGTGTTLISRLGGVQKRMPFAGGCMALASAAIAGVPPLNGFVGELLLYLGFASGALAVRGTDTALIFWAGLFVLAGIAGLALFCFTRLYGLVFLGSPRSSAVEHGQRAGDTWRLVMLTLSGLCLAAGLAAPWLFALLEPALNFLSLHMRLPAYLGDDGFVLITSVLRYLSSGSAILLALLGLAWLYKRRLLAKTSFTPGVTWDCGYRQPSARIQYSGGSFAQFPAQMMRSVLRPTMETPQIDPRENIFPRSAVAKMDVPDWPTALWSKLLFQGVARFAEAAKGLQHGLLNAYILYILIALLAALVWALGWS